MDPREELQALRDAKEKKAAAEAAKAIAEEVELLKLEAKLEAEIGPRGKDFELVDTIERPIAVKRGEGILHTKFADSKFTNADLFDYVYPCVVHPSKDAFKEIADRRPAILLRCASALGGLYGAKDKDDAGKY